MDPELAVACSDLAEELAAAAPEDRAVLLLAAGTRASMKAVPDPPRSFAANK